MATDQHHTLLRGLAGVLALTVSAAWTCTAVAATPHDVYVSLSSVFNADAIATPGTATKNGTSLDTKGDVLDAATWPASGAMTTAKFTTNSGAAITGAPVTFKLPAASNTAYNAILNDGQKITLPAGHYSEIYFLGSSTWGPVATTLQLQYHNGSKSSLPITWPNWWGPADPSATVINIKAMGPTAPAGGQAVGLYAFEAPVNPMHTLEAVQLPPKLPTQNGGPAAIQIFAISILPAQTQTTTSPAASKPSALPKTGMPLTVPLAGACLAALGLILGFQRRWPHGSRL